MRFTKRTVKGPVASTRSSAGQCRRATATQSAGMSPAGPNMRGPKLHATSSAVSETKSASSTRRRMPLQGVTTPFGTPVEPEVYIT